MDLGQLASWTEGGSPVQADAAPSASRGVLDRVMHAWHPWPAGCALTAPEHLEAFFMRKMVCEKKLLPGTASGAESSLVFGRASFE